MPASPTQLCLDLEHLLSRALSRSGTGSWSGALEAIERAGQVMPAVLAHSGPEDQTLRRCGDLLGKLRVRFVQAQNATRDELDQIRYARGRLKPTRSAYGAPPTVGTRTRFTGSA